MLASLLGSAGLLTGPASGASLPGTAGHHARPAFPVTLREHVPGRAAGPLRAEPGFSVGRWQPGLRRGSWLDTGGSAASASTWRIQPTPDPLTPNGVLDAISCPVAAACTAVGSSIDPAGTVVPLAQARTGAAWHIETALTPPGALWSKLFGVSCVSARACTAAGYYIDGAGNPRPLAEVWNGTAWRIQPVPIPAGSAANGLFAVSCTAAAACTAVGATIDGVGTTTPLAERWNGAAWRVQVTTSPSGSIGSEFLAVSCASARACTAGGTNAGSGGKNKTLAERWNGTSWRVLPTPALPGSVGSGFSGMSCGTPRSCVAAGSYDTASGGSVMLAEVWNGTAWRVQVLPAPAGAAATTLLAVSCSGRAACTAAGAYARSGGSGKTLIERWDGTSWHHQVTPDPAGAFGAQYNAVSCTSAPACVAAGISGTLSGQTLALAAGWHGSGWSGQRVPDPSGSSVDNSLDGVSCVSATDCVAAGFSTLNDGTGVTLAERWNGTSWRIQSTPNPATVAGFGGQFFAVSCTSVNACTAVGVNHDTAGQSVTLAERWNGTSWRIQSTPNPAGAVHGSFLNSVSCSGPDFCAAVGWYFGHAQSVPFAQTWDGTSWRVEKAPHRSFFGHLFGVSCTAPDNCMAVGDYGAEIWNGTSWRFQPIDVPTGSQGVELDSVSCASAGACTAVGSYFNSKGFGPLTLAEGWNGSRWSFESAPNPAKTGRNGLAGVDCTAPDACTAVGTYALSDFSPPTAYAEKWNGTAWQLQTVPTPAGTQVSALFGVSCAASGCTGTGSFVGLAGIQSTLAVRTASAVRG